MTEEKEKQIEKTVAPVENVTTPVTTASATPAKKPKKRGCLIAILVFGGVIFLYIVIQFLPFIGAFFDRSDSDVPNPPIEVGKDTSTDASKDQTPATTPKKSTTSTSNNSQYSKDDYLNYFTQLATRNSSDTLGRFTKSPVYLKVEGNIPAGSDAMLNDAISDFNALSNSIKIERNQSGSDIQLIYVLRSELDNYRNPPTIPNDAFEVEIPNDDCSYKYAKIYIGYDVMDADNLQHAIRHELTHAIGFKGHINPSTVNSIMANRIKVNDFPALDEVMIKMLYNMIPPLCASEAIIRSFFAGWNP